MNEYTGLTVRGVIYYKITGYNFWKNQTVTDKDAGFPAGIL